MSWMPPLRDGGAPIDAYVVSYVGQIGSVEQGVLAPVPGDATSAWLTGLTNGAVFAVYVAAVNRDSQQGET